MNLRIQIRVGKFLAAEKEGTTEQVNKFWHDWRIMRSRGGLSHGSAVISLADTPRAWTTLVGMKIKGN